MIMPTLTTYTVLLGLMLFPRLTAVQSNGTHADYVYGEEDTWTPQQDSTGDPETARQPSSTTQNIALQLIYSVQTGMFVAITKSGRVNANTNKDRLVAKFHVSYLLIESKEHVTIQSHKYREWYLTVNEKGKFRGGIPANGSEIFELTSLGSLSIALRSVYYTTATSPVELETSASGSGSGESGHGIGLPCGGNSTVQVSCNSTQTVQQNCYLGFSSLNGRPSCYNSTDHSEIYLRFGSP